MIDIATTTSTIENLLANSLAGELTDEQSAQFTRLLDNDAQALDQYLRLIFVAAFLRESQRGLTGESEGTPQAICHNSPVDTSVCRSEICDFSPRWRGRIFKLGQRLLRAG